MTMTKQYEELNMLHIKIIPPVLTLSFNIVL